MLEAGSEKWSISALCTIQREQGSEKAGSRDLT